MDAHDPQSPLDLVRAAQRGDAAARNELFALYCDRVLGFARARMGQGIRRDFEAGDIAQQALTVAVRKLDEFEMRHDSSFLDWLRRIVENQITDAVAWQRSAIRNRAREIALDTFGSHSRFEAAVLPLTSAQPVDEVVREEERQAVNRCIASLRSPYRDLIRARMRDGRSWQWIARHLGRPSANAARMMYATATRKLAVALQQQSHRHEERLAS